MLDRKTVGVHGDREAEAFAALPPFPEESAGHLCRLILMQLLPALHEADIAAFGAGADRNPEDRRRPFRCRSGRQPVVEPGRRAADERLGAAGAVGIGQSSWGPTGFAFVENEAAAARLYSTFVEEATAQGLEILDRPRPQPRRDHRIRIEKTGTGA